MSRSERSLVSQRRTRVQAHVFQTRTILLMALGLTAGACNQATSPQGGGGSSVNSGQSSAQQTANTQAAPDAQPRFNEVGRQTTSRVITNAEGQKGFSVRETNAAPGQPPGEATADQALAQKVKVALSTGTTGTTGTYATDTLLNIGVTARQGVITLTGEVGNQSARQALENRARSIQGVTSVDNELRIREGAPTPTPGAPAGRGQTDAVPQSQTGTAR